MVHASTALPQTKLQRPFVKKGREIRKSFFERETLVNEKFLKKKWSQNYRPKTQRNFYLHYLLQYNWTKRQQIEENNSRRA